GDAQAAHHALGALHRRRRHADLGGERARQDRRAGEWIDEERAGRGGRPGADADLGLAAPGVVERERRRAGAVLVLADAGRDQARLLVEPALRDAAAEAAL